MLRDATPEIHDPALDLLQDALAELPEPGEEIYSSAEEWPDDYDSIRVCLGPAIFPQESVDPFDPLPDDEVDEIPF